MEFLHTLPRQDGFYMPAEFAEHEGCIIVWPERPGSWSFGAREAREAFTAVIKAIAASEKVYVIAGKASIDSAREMLQNIDNIDIINMETDDSWARDIGPTFVVNSQDALRCINWNFNAWGGEVDGLYPSWDKDNAFAAAFAEKYDCRMYNAAPFVMEGGAIHSDGEGTVMVTETCLLSAGRNPELTKEQIEEKLQDYLGAKKVIWLPCGIYNDETNEHVDNVCAFTAPGEVVLAWTDKEDDPQYAMSLACLQKLETETDACGRKIKVHKLPIPDVPVCIREDEVDGYDFEDGEDMREAGERLAASYVNFYIANKSVVMPAFGGENEESDIRAEKILQELFPDRQVAVVPARAILTGGGNIHCITQQIPKGVKL